MEGKQAIPGQGKDSTSHICLFFKGSFCCQQKLGKKKKKGKWNSLTIAVYPGDQQLHFAHGRLRLKFLPQIWQRSDLGPSVLTGFGSLRRPSQKKMHTERLMQLACAHAGQSLAQGKSLWVQCSCPKITSECSLHSLQAEEKGTELLWAPNSHRSHSCKLHFLLASLVYNLLCKQISIKPLLDT